MCIISTIDKSGSVGSPLRGIAFRGISKELLDDLLEGCQVISYDYRYLYLNKAAIIQSRKTAEELIGRTMMECYPGIEKAPFFKVLQQCMENRKPKRIESEFTFPDGNKSWFNLKLDPVPEGVFLLSLDITERKEAEKNLRMTEEQLRQTQKMEATDQLASGVAHYYSNLLTIIAFSSEILLKKMVATDPLIKRVEQIKKAGEEATALTYQLFAFSRQQVLEPKIINLNDIIKNIDQLIRPLIGEDIKMIISVESKLGNIKADPGQLEQVLLNLLVNSREAMPHGGILTLETSNIMLDEKNHPESGPGPYVMLTVSDTGIGMSKKTQSHLFEPFFTTKGGNRNGLGLPMVFGIVKQSGGHIWVYSEPGQGTIFKIYFPLIKDKLSLTSKTFTDISPEGRETILLVEDDTQVREVTAFVLRMFGYSTLTAASGKEALKLCRKHTGVVHLLISDVVMPLMGGGEVAQNVKTLFPDIKVLFMSGYMDDTIVRQGIIREEVAFMQKPFTPDALGRKVRQLLDQH
jgi:PAS domain S-box-containing protein